MTEPTPLYEQTQAALDSTQPVDSTVDTGTATTPSDPAAALGMPAGPDTTALQAFTDKIPDAGHRAIAQQLVDAFIVRDQQLQAFLAAYATARSDLNTAMGNIATLQTDLATAQAAIATLQDQVAALTPAPAPTAP